MKSTVTTRRWPPHLVVAAVIFTLSLGIRQVCGLSVTSFTEDDDGITCVCNSGVMKVKICREDIVRIAYASGSSIPERSLKIVTAQWEAPQFSLTEAGDIITMQTGKIKVKVSKSTANVTYTDLSDKVILAEYAKTLTPVTVEGVRTSTVTAEWNSPSDEALYGLGQHQQGKVNYKGKTEYLDQRYAEATAISVLVSTKGYGIFWDNYSYTDFKGNISGNTRYSFSSRCSDIKGDILDYYFFYGPEIDQVIAGYRTATGHAPLFPKWAYGLIQSKDRYGSQTEFLGVKDNYRKNGIPLDCIVQDWHYWDGAGKQGCYCFNSSYGNVKSTITQCHNDNIHTLISIWSQIEEGAPPYNTFNSNKWVWPIKGGCSEPAHFIDAYNKDAREAFWDLIRDAIFDTSVIGFDGWWLDNDEPFPYPCGFDRNAITTAMGKGALFYNTYTYPLSEMGYTNWRRDIPGKRFVMLHRANYAGQQAHSTMQWSNDIHCNFDVLTLQVPCGLNSTISGIPYWCSDIGGYWGAQDNMNWSLPENRELMTRWLQYGAFCPVFRIHGNGPSKEIYQTCWDATTKNNLIMIDKLHYRLMPYIYSMAWMTTSKGYTPMRHLVFDFRNDRQVQDIGDQFMYGPSIMVCPVTKKGQTSRSVYLPEGTWYNFWTGEKLNGGARITADAPLSQIPLFVRGGSILPMGPEIQYATERSDTIELRIYPGADGSFTIYEDEGDNYNYEKGTYATFTTSYTDNNRNVIIGKREGTFPGMDQQKVFNVVFVSENHGTGGGITASVDKQIIYKGEATGILPGVHPGRKGLIPRSATIRTAGNIVALPAALAGEEKSIAVYDCSGRLLQQADAKKNMFNLRKDFKLPAGVYIVKVNTRAAR
ncbi:MAG: glycoside hydrolase family 31 protein [Chitinispirillaceae bacterium]|nr:glycoside hydrolase family 31 protein [Chitinispirillaceae bacterium]